MIKKKARPPDTLTIKSDRLFVVLGTEVYPHGTFLGKLMRFSGWEAPLGVVGRYTGLFVNTLVVTVEKLNTCHWLNVTVVFCRT